MTTHQPERLFGEKYSYECDIWSLGLTVLECATGKFPFIKEDGTKPISGFWELLTHIKTNNPMQMRVEDGYPPEICDFVQLCLCKNKDKRPRVDQLMVSYTPQYSSNALIESPIHHQACFKPIFAAFLSNVGKACHCNSTRTSSKTLPQ